MSGSQLKQMMANRITIDNQLYILLHFPVKNTAGKTMGQAAMLFLPAEERLQEIQTHVWQRTLTALVIVMITMLFIYPVIIRLTRQLSTLSTNLLNANLQTATALGNAIAKRDSDTDIHNYRVTIYSVRLAEALKLDTLTMQGLIKGAFLHDVGKIGTPDNILLKPGPLNDAEFTEMKKHVKHGVDIIKSSVWLQDAEDVVFFHHAKYNGGGYTASKEILLSGKDIPLVARIFAIVDVFDALSSHRPYKPALGFETTLAEMEKNVGSHFDPELFVTFKTIARPLYDELADRQDELPRTLLTTIVKKYFLDDLEQLLS
ncbi:MAG TPA: HD domain-containing protein [Bacteroidetes bacterium]|nr:HD domain-containing protein [Bacteroidota bacterium]